MLLEALAQGSHRDTEESIIKTLVTERLVNTNILHVTQILKKMLLVDVGYSHLIENDTETRKDEMPFTRTHSSGLERQGLRPSIWFPNLNSLSTATRITCDEQPQTLRDQQPLAFIFAYQSIGNMRSYAHLDEDPLIEAWVSSCPGLWSAAGLAGAGLFWMVLSGETCLLSHMSSRPPGCQPPLAPREWQGSMVKSLSARAWVSNRHSVHLPYPIGQPKVEYRVDVCFEYCVASVW